ncbi:tRNA (guanine(26)-N(2))-dimethyltransferase [Neocloeon triangulifer]|uniref:tRNA (guanine(26)-N(2))-dimethyltransferase n=1 Tax=Neocloeon triangulifer TaxID=2078957 RepID=UPI00286FA68A|nr:tRNA (guanine(26)-N(2))-dimethyltransferase [Neocloeon triangulifer]
MASDEPRETMNEQTDDEKQVNASETDKVIHEGQAQINVKSQDKVFYNPVQEFNRDVSVAILNLIAEDIINESRKKNESDTPTFRILEALSATGLRSIRYAKEIIGVTEVVANDLSKRAVEMIKQNVLDNNVQSIVTPNHADATLYMHQHRNQFDVIDLDPFGCPSIFLDSAVQSVKNGGVLLVTATDMAVLAGNSAETCFVKYGSVSIKSKCCHEMALRILLHCISSHANRYGKYIEPLYSMSVDFYVRVAVRVRNGASKCKYTTSKLSMVYHCVGCGTITLQPLGNCQERDNGVPKFTVAHGPTVNSSCEHCGFRHHLGGPIWTGPLYSKPLLARLSNWCGLESLGTFKRIQGIVAVMEEELETPLYFTTDHLCGVLKLEAMPSTTIRSAILNAGYKVSYSHCSRYSLKTDAPASVVWDVMRAWDKEKPARRDKFSANSAPLAILSKESKIKVDFTPNPKANPPSREAGLIRFQHNPSAFWGPGARSHARVLGEDTQAKSRQNQGKRKAKDSEIPCVTKQQKSDNV